MSYESLSSRAVIGMFFSALEAHDLGWVDAASTRFESDQASETYAWLGMAPAMREWIGGRWARGFREQGITLYNKKFEATLEIAADDLRRDKTAQLRLRIGELATRSESHWTALITDLLEAGDVAPCYDGFSFFDTDHEEGESGVQSNIIEHVVLDPAVPTVADFQGALWEAITRMLAFKDDQNELLQSELQTFHVVAPNNFFKLGLEALAPTLHPTGDRYFPFNPLRIAFDVNARLSWTDQFAVFATGGRGVAAFIRQEEFEPKMSSLAEGSDYAFKNDRHLYGVHASRTANYGLWQRAVLVKLL